MDACLLNTEAPDPSHGLSKFPVTLEFTFIFIPRTVK